MTRDELLDELRELELNLRSPEVQDFFLTQPVDVRNKFVSYREEISFLVGKLTNAELEEIADKLDELSDDINAGITSLREKIQALNDAIEIINALGTVLGHVARIAAIAV